MRCYVNQLLKNKYIEKMLELIKPRGKLVGVVFTEPLNAKIPPFRTSK